MVRAAALGARAGRAGDADVVAAGALAAEEALGEAGVGAGEDTDEVQVEDADGVILLGHLGEGTGELIDVVVAVALAAVHHAALLLHDASRLPYPLVQG